MFNHCDNGRIKKKTMMLIAAHLGLTFQDLNMMTQGIIGTLMNTKTLVYIKWNPVGDVSPGEQLRMNRTRYMPS